MERRKSDVPVGSNMARFKRGIRSAMGPRVRFEMEEGFVRVGGIPRVRERMLKEKLVELSCGLKWDGWDEDGNACWWAQPGDYLDVRRVG